MPRNCLAEFPVFACRSPGGQFYQSEDPGIKRNVVERFTSA
jgi:hypothetical protein